VTDPKDHANLISSVADLRGDYKQSEYGKVILPLTVIQRLDSVCDRADPSSKARSSPRAGRQRGERMPGGTYV
jgi:type I restriction enzyme M protein